MKILNLLKCTAFLLLPIFANAQCTSTADPYDNSVCVGDVENLSVSPPSVINNLLTTSAGGNQHSGNMFEIRALTPITIDSFHVNPQNASGTVMVYYKAGSYSGYELQSNAWTLVGSAYVVYTGNLTSLPIHINVPIPANTTYSFYVTYNSSTALKYTDGSSEGSVYASNSDLEFLQGIGLSYPFAGGSSSYLFRPRIFNGRIFYSKPMNITYNWSNGSNASSISPVITSDTSFSVTVNANGCQPQVLTFDIEVNTPDIDAGQDVISCNGAEVVLNATSNEVFVWNNGVVNGVPFVPTQSGYYTATAVNSDGCIGKDSVYILVETLTANVNADLVNNILTASPTNMNYVWYNCDNHSVVPNENSLLYIPTANGNYSVIISDNNCVDTSSCVTIFSLGEEDFNSNDELIIYPNPTTHYIQFSNLNVATLKSIILMDLTGRSIQVWNNLYSNTINLPELKSGVYILKFETNSNTITKSIVIE